MRNLFWMVVLLSLPFAAAYGQYNTSEGNDPYMVPRGVPDSSQPDLKMDPLYEEPLNDPRGRYEGQYQGSPTDDLQHTDKVLPLDLNPGAGEEKPPARPAGSKIEKDLGLTTPEEQPSAAPSDEE